MKLVFATKNIGKLQEMRELLSDLKIHVMSASEAGFLDEVEEDQPTIKANAKKKALVVATALGEWAVSDDTGLFIKSLDEQPGVLANRWAGGEDLVEFTLRRMKNIPEGKRQAYFKSAICLSSPDGLTELFSGIARGKITMKPRGVATKSLMYDSIFLPNGYFKTLAEMTMREKNTISHRGLAFVRLKHFLRERLEV